MSFLATRVGIDGAGGGLVLAGGQTLVTINGAPWAIQGDDIGDHGSGAHDAATIAGGSSVVRINSVPIARGAHAATCGHKVTGSGPVSVSD